MKVVIIGGGEVGFHVAKALSEEDYESCLDEFGDERFEVSIGAEAIKKILRLIS